MDGQLSSLHQLFELLALAEGSGRVEFKRSCLWPTETELSRVQGVLMRLSNSNAEIGGIVELGREDNGIRVGLVDKELERADQRRIAAAEQQLVGIANRLRPAMQIRWQPLTHSEDLTTIAVLVPGRQRSRWYQDERGVSITGSASHPIIADPDLLRGWALEDLHRVEREQLEQQRHAMLRTEYMASHDGITPGLMAGTQPLPAAWEASRRRALGWD